MKRLLAVSWEMPPMYGPRAAQVSRSINALAALGWSVTVLTMAPRRGGPHWPDGIEPPAMAASVEVHRVPSPEEWFAMRALGRLVPWTRRFPDEKRVWIPAATRRALELLRSQPFDAVITFAQPWSDHLIGLRLQAATRLPWLAHFSDPWVDSPYATGSRWQRRLAEGWERQVAGSATALVFVNRQTADLVMTKYPAEWRRKVAVVPHGYDRRVRPATRPRVAGPLRIVYTGRFYRGLRTPEGLLRALARLGRTTPLDGRIQVSLIGPFVTDYRRQAAALGVESLVRFEGRRSQADAHQAAADADVLLVVDAPSDGPNVFLPSKLVDYLPFAKPILGLTPTEGATADLLRRLECPIAPPDDEAAIASALDGLLRRHEAAALQVSPVFARVAEEFDIDRTTLALDRAIQRAIDGAPH
jgi:glycosyltransferase involved in cell wall biosynthesis